MSGLEISLVDIIQRSARLAPATKSVYLAAAKRFDAFAYATGGARTPTTVEAFRDDLLSRVSPQTARKVLAALKYVGRRVADLELGADFARAIEMPKGGPGERRESLILDEARGVIRVCRADLTLRGLRDTAMIETSMIATAARRTELSALDRQDFDPRQRTLRLQRKGGWIQICALDPGTCAAIEVWLEARGGHDEDPMFVRLSVSTQDRLAIGGRLSGAAICTVVAARARQAGIDRRVTTHVLRHSHFGLGLMAGVGLERLSMAAGHRRPTDGAPTVAATYRHDLRAREEPVGLVIRNLLDAQPEHPGGGR